MNKLCLSCLGALLLAFYLTSQIQAQTTIATMTPNATMTMTMTMNMTMNMSMSTSSTNTTEPTNGCGRTDAWTVLLPLTVAASLLHIWS